jgi:hypothetical protein
VKNLPGVFNSFVSRVPRDFVTRAFDRSRRSLFCHPWDLASFNTANAAASRTVKLLTNLYAMPDIVTHAKVRFAAVP